MVRLIKIGLLLTFLVCYIDFGHDGAGFIGIIEYSLLKKIPKLVDTLQNPLFVLAFVGQILIFISTFVKWQNKKLTMFGLVCLGIIVLLIFAIGLLDINFPVILSTIPFMTIATIYIIKGQSKRAGCIIC